MVDLMSSRALGRTEDSGFFRLDARHHLLENRRVGAACEVRHHAAGRHSADAVELFDENRFCSRPRSGDCGCVSRRSRSRDNDVRMIGDWQFVFRFRVEFHNDSSLLGFLSLLYHSASGKPLIFQEFFLKNHGFQKGMPSADQTLFIDHCFLNGPDSA